MRKEWRSEVADLDLDGRKEEALALVREEASEGNMAARVLLARMERWVSITSEEADRIVDEVALNMDPNDVQAHLELSSAYKVGVGNIPYDEQSRRSFDHLLKAVELGADPVFAVRLARDYALGTLTVKPNQSEAIRWYKHAIQRGSIEAAHELQKYYRHLEKLQGKRRGTLESRKLSSSARSRDPLAPRNDGEPYFHANTGCSSSATRVLRPASTSRNW
jgi:TPR repeat protein